MPFRVQNLFKCKMSLSTRLTFSYLAVILLGMLIIAPLAWLAVERLYLSTQKVNLLAQAQLIAAALSSEAQPSASLPASTSMSYSQVMNTVPGIHTRVLDNQGAVVISLAEAVGPQDAPAAVELPQLAQNAAGLVTTGELLGRPEIASARQGQPATAVRRVQTAGDRRVLYAAAPVRLQDGSVTQIVYLATPLPDTQWAALPASLRWQLAGVLLMAFLLAGAAGLLLARRISDSLGRLAKAAHAVSGGDLQQTVPEDPSISELTVLGQAFNKMTSSLRQADQVKNAFIADVSHELRTPLTVIKGTIETLQDGALDDLAARGPFLDSMGRETERLIRLVNDLLVLARADAGALNLQLHPLDLAELARARCAQLQGPAGQRGVRLVVEPVSQPDGKQGFQIMADPDRMAQVLDNLLDNAICYSHMGGQVTVRIEREPGKVTCQVIDSGPGIPAKHLPLIFERFYRVDPARERGQGGSGLGLSIVRGLVMAHGGQVAAASLEGQGTTITFWLLDES